MMIETRLVPDCLENIKTDEQKIQLFNEIYKDPAVFQRYEEFKLQDCKGCNQCILRNKLKGNDLIIRIIDCFLDYCKVDFFLS
jgi:hypothetical protein